MKRIICLFIGILCLWKLTSDELKGFFGVELGESFEEISKKDYFSLFGTSRARQSVFFRFDDSINLYYYRNYKLEKNEKTKKIIKSNNPDRPRFFIFKEEDEEKNNLKLKYRELFKYGGSYPWNVEYAFLNNHLVGICFCIASSWFFDVRSDDYKGFVEEQELGLDLPKEQRDVYFSALEQALVEKYSLKPALEYCFVERVLCKYSCYAYISEDNTTVVLFYYKHVDPAFDKSEPLDKSSGEIYLVDLKSIKEYQNKKNTEKQDSFNQLKQLLSN